MTVSLGTLSFQHAFETHFPFVCRALRRLGVHEGDVFDVAQEVFLTVHAHAATYDGARALQTWLYTFARNHAANYRRLKRTSAHDAPQSETAAPPSSPRRNARDVLRRALATLDEDQREAVVMHDLEGFSAPEVAELTGQPMNTIYSRIRLGRVALKAQVERLQGEHHGRA
jgi:RNA polymerase sigma factor (sigma-70 family)